MVEDLGASRKATRKVSPFTLQHGLEQQVFRHFGEVPVLQRLEVLEDASHFSLHVATAAILCDVCHQDDLRTLAEDESTMKVPDIAKLAVANIQVITAEYWRHEVHVGHVVAPDALVADERLAIEGGENCHVGARR